MNLEKTIQQLKKLPNYDVDELINTQHQIAFSEINCLDCANCCKTTPALLNQEDIHRISKHLKLDKKSFLQQYTKLDDDLDTVFKTSPCVFLANDNTCKIYEIRPFACKDYPHTHRKNQKNILNLSKENYKICPAVAQIFNNIDFS